jgi:hypothetical protein
VRFFPHSSGGVIAAAATQVAFIWNTSAPNGAALHLLLLLLAAD